MRGGRTMTSMGASVGLIRSEIENEPGRMSSRLVLAQ
jgi:hypothetical protein